MRFHQGVAISLVFALVVFPVVAQGPLAGSLQIETLQLPAEAKGPLPSLRPLAPNPPFAPLAPPRIPFGQGYAGEVEPNGTFGTATPLASTNLVVRAALFPNGDIDFYSFSATAGDRVYAATMTSFSAGSSTDSQITLLATDGTTVIEFDDDNGSLAGLSSSVAGATIPTTGTYFLRINDFTAGTTSERPYELHLRVQSGSPTPEVEANDTPATANPLPASGWVSGARNPAAAAEMDYYSLSLNAGDTVYLSLDVDPERDGTVWNGRLGIALFGDASNQILVVDDAGTGDVLPVPNIPSEALFMTVKTAGTYFAFVDSASALVGGPTATYNLSVSVHPATNEGVNCTTYTSTDVPKTIGPGTGLVSSVITVPGNPRIADVDVDIVLNHALMGDIDAHLRSPAGDDNGLFTDIGSPATLGQTQMDTVFDDEAGVPPVFTVLRGVQIKPELNYRLAWFDGENAGGTWTLDLRDDTAGANGGTLTAWSLRICEAPPVPSCAPGFAPTTVFSTDFEAGAAGFTHSGTADEWEIGLPATVATTTANPIAAFNTCNSGTSCWKTDLDNTYNVSSMQDLLSPNINLAGLAAPIVVNWAQRYQMESASFDHLFVDAQQAGGATPVRLFEWLDATMTNAPGNPAVNVPASAGWAVFSRRADSLAGLNSELRFHVDSDTTINFGGLAVDDVSVTACRPLSADLAITKTDGVTTAVPGTSVTYTITASNAGADGVTGATVADTFSAAHAGCTWTCVGAGGGTCTAAGSGNINDTVDLPVGGSATYTAICGITFGATGSLVNTATVSSAVTDPVPGNNSATDTDTLTPMADLSMTKTDGVTSATPGGSVTYTLVATNAGPSNAVSSTVTDTFPVACTSVTWTCVGAGGTCTAAGLGNISDAVNLPAGALVTYTATCSISGAATGALSNTASVTSATTDPTPGNNSATDIDTLVAVQADVSITKTDGAASEIPGTTVAYTIVASNAGPAAAPAATVADTFPATLSGCTWTCSGAGGGTCAANGAGDINQSVNLPSGGSVTFTATCTIAASATGSLANTATVEVGAGLTDPTPANNSATDTDTLTPQANLAVTKTDGLTTASPNQATTYTIVVSNVAGPSNAPAATVTDTFPAGFTGATWTCVGAGGSSCTANGAGNLAESVNLPVGGSVTFTVNGTIAGAFTGTLSNTATVAAGTGVTDPTPADDSATDTTLVVSAASVSGTKAVAGNFSVGGTVMYTIVLTNTGSTQLDNTGDEFSDTVPPELTVTNATASAGTAAFVGNVVTWNGTIAGSGGTVTITITATVNSVASGTVVVNQGSISFDADGNGTNEMTVQTDDPAAGGGSDPTDFVVGGGVNVLEIPTVSELGLTFLALLLAGLGFAVIRRRS